MNIVIFISINYITLSSNYHKWSRFPIVLRVPFVVSLYNSGSEFIGAMSYKLFDNYSLIYIYIAYSLHMLYTSSHKHFA